MTTNKHEDSVIILGSSRSNGDTRKILEYLTRDKNIEIIDLLNYNISYYDYEHKNQNDDFIPLMDRISQEYRHIIFATPVYWYSMSAVMKCFFDRITDMLKLKKEVGRRLRNMNMSVISCSGGNDLNRDFISPFLLSADYLGMEFNKHLHTWLIDGEISVEVLLKIGKFFD